jgi:hypothetical protein
MHPVNVTSKEEIDIAQAIHCYKKINTLKGCCLQPVGGLPVKGRPGRCALKKIILLRSDEKEVKLQDK